MPNVCVCYRQTRGGLLALRFAVDVARTFQLGGIHVYVAENALSLQSMGPDSRANSAQLERIRQAVTEVAGDLPVTFECFEESAGLPELPPDAILIDGERAKQRRNEHIISCAEESSLTGRRCGPMLIPFSDEESGLVAATIGFELAARWKQTHGGSDDHPDVVLYHTTWKDPERMSDPAIDQMCESATRVMITLEREAAARGLKFETIVETHDDVVQGAIEMAHKISASLVVMARGAHIRQGSYVERTIEQCPVPVLVAGAKTPLIAQAASHRDFRSFRAQRERTLLEAASAPQPPLMQRIAQSPVLRSPLFVMGLVAAMYAFKCVAKIAVGLWINSPMVTGDGFHNIADLVQALAVFAVIIIARKPSDEHYPYGRKNIEWFTSLAIGIMLFFAALKFIADCSAGLLSYWPAGDAFFRHFLPFLPHVEPSALDSATLPWVLAVTIGSFALSLVVSRYQMVIGRRTGHISMVADGAETMSDGWIEAVTVFGIITEFATGWKIIEYPLGLFVAFLILRTVKELFVSAFRVLLQHSIGAEHEETIRAAAMSVAGVNGLGELKTFQVGHTAVVLLTVESLSGERSVNYVKKAVEDAVARSLTGKESDFKSADVHIKMQRPDPQRHRVGYLIRVDDTGSHIAANLQSATHLAVCDIEHGDVERSKVVPLEHDIVWQFLDKRVQSVFVLHAPDEDRDSVQTIVAPRLASWRARGVVPEPQLEQVNCYTLSTLGLVL